MAPKALKEKLEENLYDNKLYDSIVAENDSCNVIPFTKQQESQLTSVVPDFAITMSEAKQRILTLQQFVKEMMVEGQDYGLIPNCNKPSLFKAGAEKLTDIFGFSKHIEITNRLEDWEKGLFHYEVKATLINKRSGQIEAEGIGCCNNKEKKYASTSPFNIINTILKMAKKRAFVDAVLSATRSSGLFTQDIEDISDEDYQHNPQYPQSYSQNNKNFSPTTGQRNAGDSNKTTQNIYVPEQKEQSISNSNQKTEKFATKAQLNKVQSIVNEKQIAVNTARFLMSDRYGVSESRNLTVQQADDFIKYLSKIK